MTNQSVNRDSGTSVAGTVNRLALSLITLSLTKKLYLDFSFHSI